MEYHDEIKKNCIGHYSENYPLKNVYITQDPREKRDLLYKSFPDLK